MSIFDWFKSKASTKALDPSQIVTIDMLGQLASNSMSESKAMKVEAYFSCLRDKAETVGQIPLKLYRNTGMRHSRSRERVYEGRNHRIFTEQPCDYLNMIGFLEMATVTIERQGVFYAVIERNDRGSVMGIIPFWNQAGINKQMDFNGNVYYTYVTNSGRDIVTYDPYDLFIVQGFTVNGVNALSPIVQCATMLGIANSQDQNYKELQDEGITSQMALKTENTFTDSKAIQRLKEDWTQYRGAKGRKNIPILEQGLTPVSLKLTPQESELLGNREFTINRICRMTRVPVHRVGSEDSSSKSTIFELDEAYMMNVINPLLTKIEYEFNRFIPTDHRVEFDRKAFYRGSPWRLVESVEREVKGGLASINEGRVDLGREVVEGGDVFAVDNNNVTYAKWTEVKEIQERLYQSNQPQQQQGQDNGSEN